MRMRGVSRAESDERNTRLFYELVKGFSDQVWVDRLTIGLGEYESGGVPRETRESAAFCL